MKPLIVVAGGGSSGRALVERVVGRWRVRVIDIDADALEKLTSTLSEDADVTCIEGDATSTLVLKKADLEDASFAVATTADDEVNLEFCRLVKERFNTPRRLAVVSSIDLLERFREEGITAVSRAGAVASIVESHLDDGLRTTADVGLGMGEIVEVTVQRHSPVIGRTLASLRPQLWLVGAVYREDDLVVPHGNTFVKEGDRVLLIGDPKILPSIAEYFQRGESEFPLQYGTRIGVVDPDSGEVALLDEAAYFVESTSAVGITVMVRDEAARSATQAHFADKQPELDFQVDFQSPDWPENLLAVQDKHDLAVLAFSAPRMGWLERFGMGAREFMRALDLTTEPVLVSRGTHPYRRILLGMDSGAGALEAAELAVEVVRKLGATLTAVAVLPPAFVSGEAYHRELEEAIGQAENIGNLYHLKMQTELMDGNPIERLVELAQDYDLLVTSHRQRRAFSLTQPDVSRYLILSAPCSVLVMPHGKKSSRGG